MAVPWVFYDAMRAVQLHELGDTDVLQVDTVDRPTPDVNELLIEVAAAGINPVDTYFRTGAFGPVTPPFTPGVDYAGTVVEVGERVDGFEPGDRVFGTGIGNTDYQGSYREFATVPEHRTVHLPDGVDFRQAGAAGVASVTSWRALIDHAELKPAESCLIHGGSGGVGHAAVQVASALNADVIATAATSYHEGVKRLGARAVLDYNRDDLIDAVGEVSGGVDVILDHRLDDYLQFDAEVAAKFARVVGIGENEPTPAFTNDTLARLKDVNYQFMTMFNTPDFRVPLRGVAHLMEQGALDIEIARTYDLEEAPEVHRAVMEDSFMGKLVIEP